MIPKLLRHYDLDLSDIDVIEINEAFASMAVYCRDELKLDWTKMNPRGGQFVIDASCSDTCTNMIVVGGAIALGHPFGCTGVRQIVTGLSECRRRQKEGGKGRLLITSMCMGTGMGMAGLFVNEVG